MAQTMDEFIAGMRKDIERWKGDLAKLEAVGNNAHAETVREWIAAGERIIAIHWGKDA